MGIGDGTPGSTAMFLRSSGPRHDLDAGAISGAAEFGASGPSGPIPPTRKCVLAGTKYGHLFRSLDGGIQLA